MVNTIVNQDKISKSGFSFPLGPQHLLEALFPSCLGQTFDTWFIHFVGELKARRGGVTSRDPKLSPRWPA